MVEIGIEELPKKVHRFLKVLEFLLLTHESLTRALNYLNQTSEVLVDIYHIQVKVYLK
jgi:hypothetical protein